jgi:TPP-dependent pyruvate/acetoin dehydrogenase alpha subunit
MPKKDKPNAVRQPAEKPADGQPSFSLISNDKLIEIYQTMVKCRILAERLPAAMVSDDAAQICREAAGLEASFVGAAIDLGRQDAIGLSSCELFTELIRLEQLKGPQLKKLVGKRSSARRNGASPSHAAAASFDAAVAKAQAQKKGATGKVTIAFARNGSASLESWSEALSIARIRSLPLIFVLQHSSCGATETPKRRSKIHNIASRAQAIGVPGVAVDGSDAVAVYRVAHESIARARKGRGPTLIECVPFVLEETTKRRAAAVRSSDPIRNMEQYLASKKLFSAKLRNETARKFREQLNGAIASTARS